MIRCMRMSRARAIARATGVVVALALSGAAAAESFVSTPTRSIGPLVIGQVSPAPSGGWTAADNRTVGASIIGQQGWTGACGNGKFDEEILAGGGREGGNGWRLSNWYHDGCVNHLTSPAFAPAGEAGSTTLVGGGIGPASASVSYEFWFRSASAVAEPGTYVSTTISDAPGRRMTYLGLFDERPGDAGSGCSNIAAGCFHVNAVDVADGATEDFVDHRSPDLQRGVWYRMRIDAQFIDGPLNDQVHYTLFDASGATVWQVTIGSWEDSYFDGMYGSPAGDRVAVDHVAFRVSGNPDDGTQSNGGTYSVTNRPHGIVLDDLRVTPGSGAGIAAGFESDRWVSPSGSDAGNDCRTQASPCQTVAWAISQAVAYDTIHVGAGTYAIYAPLSVTTPGLKLVGDAGKPVIERVAQYGGTPNQPLLVVNGARDVRVENLDFRLDQSFVAEGILASGFVDGLAIVGNHFGTAKTAAAAAAFGYRNAVSINDVRNSLGLPRGNGSSVLIDSNTVDGINGAVALRSGIDMDAGVGVIRNNTVTAGTHDIIVRFATVVAGSGSNRLSIQGNTLTGRGLEFDAPNASVSAVDISGNTVGAIAGIDSSTNYPADYALMRLIGNAQHVGVTVSGNQFSGHQGKYRGLLVENFPDLALVGNVFSPAAGATDFVSLVVSNKAINTDNPADAPLTLSLVATGNTFHGSGVANAGTAVEMLNDNDASGTAAFGSLTFGGAGSDANQFDGSLRWYFHLDDYSCDTVTTPCAFLNYAGAIGSNAGTNTQVRPFRGSVAATQNLFGGLAPAAMTPAQQTALLARTYDRAANAALGAVDYGLTATESVVYVDDGYAGAAYGDGVSFSHGAVSPGTVYVGLNAFASIGDGLAHVTAGGTVYVAKGSYPTALTLARHVHLIGDGSGDADPAHSTVLGGTVTVAASGAGQGDPLLLNDLRITGVNGDGIRLSGSQSYLALDGVASSGNSGNGFLAGGSASTTQYLSVSNSHFDGNGHFPPQFDGDLVAGFNFGENASGLHVTISGSSFNGNNGAGLVVNQIGSASSLSTIQDWTISGSDFSRNVPLDPSDPNLYSAGGGLWLKTGAAGSVIKDVLVQGSTFADNGTGRTSTFPSLPSRRINANGINLRARPNTTLSNVRLCDNSFSETAAPGTQQYGIYVFDDTQASNHGYQAVEICGTTTFSGLLEGVSGYEQFALRGNQPVVNITGGFNVTGGGTPWNYIRLATSRSVVYVDDDFAGKVNGDAVSFTHPATGTVAAVFGDDAFASLSAAVARVQAAGTVYVAAGTYADNVVLDKPVAVVGAGRAATTVVPALFNPDCSAGGGTPDSVCSGSSVPASIVFLARSSGVEISALAVDGINPSLAGHETAIAARNGIMTDVDGGPYLDFKVHDTDVRNIYLRGLYAASIGGTFEFRGNTLSHVKSDPSSIAIFSRYSGGIVDGNTVDDAADALAANWSKGITFSNNTVTNSGSGIHSDNSHGAGGGAADLIEGNDVSCAVQDAYGIWSFAPYADITVRDNRVAACAVGLGAFGGRTDSAAPLAVTRFLGNRVDAAGAIVGTPGDPSIGAWFDTTTFYYGEYPNQVELSGNTLTGFGVGVQTRRGGGKSLTTAAHFNRIVGNTAGWIDAGEAASGSNGTSDFTNNWWGCNGGPNTAGCDAASGVGASAPWLVLGIGATPQEIAANAPSSIVADLTRNSANAQVGSAFPDGTAIAFAATAGSIGASANTASGQASATLTDLATGWSTVSATLDHATATVLVHVTGSTGTVVSHGTGTHASGADCAHPGFTSIQAAIDALPAGSEILVCSGTYAENLVVTKSVTLRGAQTGSAGPARSGAEEAVVAPATGNALRVNADDVVFDGFTIQGVNDTAIVSGGNYGGGSHRVAIRNNRVLDVHAGSGLYTNGDPVSGRVYDWTVSDNLFRNIESPIGSGINLWKVTGGTISGNRVESSAFGGIQTNGGIDVSIDGNTVVGTAHNGINVAQAQNVAVTHNQVTDANGSATADEAGLTLYGGSQDVTFACNRVDGNGSQGFSTASAIALPLSGVRVFHNEFAVAANLSHNLAQGLSIGSNWYGGAAPTVAGSNAAGLQVASALPASPIGNALCGDNSAAAIGVVGGAPQTAVVNSAFAQPLVARVTDALGGAVAGASVNFAAPAFGASASLSQTVAVTDYDGRAGSAATANLFVGNYAISAGSGSLSPASFALGNTLGPAAQIVASGGTHFDGVAGQLLVGALPAVRVTDGSGNPVGGVAVTFAAGSNSGSLSGAVQNTGANGIATLGGWLLSATPGSNTVTATAAGLAPQSVVFDATGTAQSGLSVAITDQRDYVQYGRLLTYVISVGNAGPSSASAVAVSSFLPAELDGAAATWSCLAQLNGATCTASGSGPLSDSVNLPAGSSLTYVVTVPVRDNGLPSDLIVTSASAGAASASDATIAVLYRDGFENGGDGAQNGPVVATVAPGLLDATHSADLDLAALRLSEGQVLVVARARDAAGHGFRVEALRLGTGLWLRLVGSVDGREVATPWVPADAKALVGLALLQDAQGATAVELVGALGPLRLPLGAAATALRFDVYAVQP